MSIVRDVRLSRKAGEQERIGQDPIRVLLLNIFEYLYIIFN